MAFTRITRPERDFSIISNLICRNPNISLKALGVYFKVMSFPETWSFTVAGLIDVVPDGKHVVYQALKELQEYGYCSVETVRDGGRIAGTIYHFYDTPRNSPYTDFQDTVKQDTENQDAKKQPQLNKNRIKKEINTVVDVVNLKASQKNKNQSFPKPKALTEFELGAATESLKIKADITTLKESWAGFEKEKQRWIKENANITEFESELHAANTFKKRMVELARLAKQVGTGKQQPSNKPAFGSANNPAAKPQYNGAKYYAPGCEQIFKEREEREKKAKAEAEALKQAQAQNQQPK